MLATPIAISSVIAVVAAIVVLLLTLRRCRRVCSHSPQGVCWNRYTPPVKLVEITARAASAAKVNHRRLERSALSCALLIIYADRWVECPRYFLT